MAKYLITGIFIFGLAVTYQNCEGALEEGSGDNSVGSVPPLTFRFDNKEQSVQTTSANMIIEGLCNVTGFVDHRVDWEFTYNGNRVTGRTDRPCSSFSGRFSLVIGITNFTKTDKSELVFVGILSAIDKKGLTARGEQAQIKIKFQTASTTGSTTGGSTGSTTGGTFAANCPDEAANGAIEYCNNDPNYHAFCSSITHPPDASHVVDQVADEHPELIAQCDRSQADNPQWNAFTREVVSRLRDSNGNWGFNGVRGNINDINGDTISWWGAPGLPQENQPGNVIIDVVSGCESPSAAPAWQVLTPYCQCCMKYI